MFFNIKYFKLFFQNDFKIHVQEKKEENQNKKILKIEKERLMFLIVTKKLVKRVTS